MCEKFFPYKSEHFNFCKFGYHPETMQRHWVSWVKDLPNKGCCFSIAMGWIVINTLSEENGNYYSIAVDS